MQRAWMWLNLYGCQAVLQNKIAKNNTSSSSIFIVHISIFFKKPRNTPPPPIFVYLPTALISAYIFIEQFEYLAPLIIDAERRQDLMDRL